GKIMLNNLDITEAPVNEVRAKIGLVPQQALLFSGTIAENIRFGNRLATDEDIRRAAEIAQASEFIEKLPEKYETKIEQGGTNLYCVKKQRLSIARTLVRRTE